MQEILHTNQRNDMTALIAKPGLRQRALLVSTVAAALLATACGNAAVPLDTATPTVTAKPADPTTPSTGTPVETSEPSSEASLPTVPGETTIIEPAEVIVVDGRTVEVPPGLRFPEDAKVNDALGRMISFTAPGKQEFADWFRTEFPRAGYEVITDLEDDFITFDGRGWGGTLFLTGGEVKFVYGQYEPESDEVDADAVDDSPMTPRELNIVNVPWGFRFPPMTEITDLDDTSAGAAFTIISPTPAEVLEFYENNVLTTVHFDILDKQTSGTGTTISFADADGTWMGSMVFGDDVVISFEAPDA